MAQRAGSAPVADRDDGHRRDRGDGYPQGFTTLTDREREVLALLAEGLSDRAIAQRIFVAERTVEAHNKRIFDKLALTESPDRHRRVLAVLTFLRA